MSHKGSYWQRGYNTIEWDSEFKEWTGTVDGDTPVLISVNGEPYKCKAWRVKEQVDAEPIDVLSPDEYTLEWVTLTVQNPYVNDYLFFGTSLARKPAASGSTWAMTLSNIIVFSGDSTYMACNDQIRLSTAWRPDSETPLTQWTVYYEGVPNPETNGFIWTPVGTLPVDGIHPKIIHTDWVKVGTQQIRITGMDLDINTKSNWTTSQTRTFEGLEQTRMLYSSAQTDSDRNRGVYITNKYPQQVSQTLLCPVITLPDQYNKDNCIPEMDCFYRNSDDWLEEPAMRTAQYKYSMKWWITENSFAYYLPKVRLHRSGLLIYEK